MDGPGPAIVSALNAALGTRIASLPELPEDVMAALGPSSVQEAA
jgi:CO/xanthine dehydrogenase Mo-binding subunit